MSAEILIESAENFSKKYIDDRVIVEALISAGVASCIAGSSRPCSGAEHLFSHAIDHLEFGIGLHGEKCGIGSIMIAKLQGQNWKEIVKTLKKSGAPTTAKEIGLKPKILAKAMVMAQSLRPERYTILKEVKMTEKDALKLAKSTGVYNYFLDFISTLFSDSGVIISFLGFCLFSYDSTKFTLVRAGTNLNKSI